MFSNATAPQAEETTLIKDANIGNFMQEVVQASLQVPVMVYFWAPWCGTCKPFTPLLEKTVTAAGGSILLRKINIDENKQLATQFRIQSVPTVYVLFQGQPVDAFNGVLPESQLKQFIARFAGESSQETALAEFITQADTALEENNLDVAMQLYEAVLQHEPEHADAWAGKIRCFVLANMLDEAAELADTIPAKIANNAKISSAKAALTLAQQAQSSGDLSALEKAVSANPLDHQARYDLATAYFAAGRQEDAIEALLAILAKNLEWNEQAARTQLITYFEALGATHPLTLKGRRRLSSLLFS